jgi:acyl-CoA thioesterase FadM
MKAGFQGINDMKSFIFPLTTDTILIKAEVKVVWLNQTFRPRPLPRQLHEFSRES